MLFANPLLAWLSIPEGHTNSFLDWSVHLFLELLAPFYCLVVCGAMMRDEAQEETLGFLITRPITRARLFLGKYLCLMAWLQVVVGVNGGLLVAGGYAKGIEAALPLAGLILGAGALAVLAYSALGALFGLLSRRYVVLGLVYGFLVEIGIGHIPTNINSLSMMRHVHTILANHEAVRDRFGWSPEGTGVAILIMLVAAAVALTAGALFFTVKEFQVSRDNPKD